MASIEDLAAKLDANALSLGFVPLAAVTPDPNWDPLKHPHGKHGHWAKKGEATYHALLDLAAGLGKSKKASFTGKPGTFTVPGQEGSSSGKPKVKVGGVVLSPPDPSHEGGSVDYALHPGEKAFTATTPTSQSVVVVHADNSATELKPTSATQPPEIVKQFKPGEIQVKQAAGKIALEQLDSYPGSPLTPAAKGLTKGSLVISASHAAALPIGTVVRKRNLKYAHVWEDWQKGQGGTWVRVAAFKKNTAIGTKKSPDAFGLMVSDGKSSSFIVEKAVDSDGTPEPPKIKSQPKPDGLPVTSTHALKALGADAGVHVKVFDGSWHEWIKSNGTPSSPKGSVYGDWTSNGVIKTSDELWDSYKSDMVLTTPGSVEPSVGAGTPEKPKHYLNQPQFEAALVGAQVMFESVTNGKSYTSGPYIKQPGGKWLAPSGTLLENASFTYAATNGELYWHVEPESPPAKKKAEWSSAPGTVVSFAEHVEALPVGTILHNAHVVGTWGDYQKLDNGDWKRIASSSLDTPSITLSPSQFAEKVAGSANSTTTVSILNGTPEPPKISVGHFKDADPSGPASGALLAGVKMNVPTIENLTVDFYAAHLENHSGTSNKFYKLAVIKHDDGSAWLLKQFGSNKPGSKVNTLVESFPSADAAQSAWTKVYDQKIKGGYSEADVSASSLEYKSALIAHLKQQPQYQQSDAEKDGGVAVPQPGMTILSAAQMDALPIGSEVHYSGSVNSFDGNVTTEDYVKTDEGWKLADSILIIGDESFSESITNGYLTVKSVGAPGTGPGEPPASHDLLGSDPWGPHPTPETPTSGGVVPGTDVTLGSGESLYASKFAKTKFAVVKDGKVIKLLDKESGSDISTHQGLWNWNKSLSTGKLHLVSGDAQEVPPGPSVGDPVKSPEAAHALPVGTKIEGSAGATWVKSFIPSLDGGGTMWVGPDGIPADVATLNPNPAHPWKIVSLPAQPKIGDTVKSLGQANALPTGIVIGYPDHTSSFTKQKNGKWTASQTGVEYAPADLNWDNPWKVQSTPAVKKAATKKKFAPKKGSSLGSLNTSYELPSGGSITPGPGEHFLLPTPEYLGSGMLWKLTSSGKLVTYNATNGVVMSTSAPGGKKSLKSLTAAGAVVVASGPPKLTVELPVGTPTKTFDTVNDLIKYAANSNSWMHADALGDDLKAKMTAALLEPGQVKGDFNPYVNGPISSALAKPEVAQEISNLLASLLAGREKYKNLLPVGNKAKLSKSVISLTGVLRLAVLAQRLNEEGHQVSEQDKAELAEIGQIKVVNGLQDSSDYNRVFGFTWLSERLQQQEFLQSVKDLGFDPLNATTEQAQQYAHGKGASNAAGMTAEDAKQWMLLDLNAPQAGNSGQTKTAIESKAGVALQVAAVAANAKVVAAKKAATAPTKPEIAQAKAVDAKLYADHKTLAAMHNQYTGPKGDLIFNWTDGNWTLAGKMITASQAVEEVKDPKNKWKPGANSEPIGSPSKQIANGLTAQYGEAWKSAPADILSSIGAANANTMQTVYRVAWLRAHLRGDMYAKYWISAEAGPMPDPVDHVSGPAAEQGLSNWLATRSWWHPDDVPGAWPALDVEAAANELGLSDAWAVSQPDGSFKEPGSFAQTALLREWRKRHNKIPPPQAQAGTTFTASDGKAVDLEPGDLVAQAPDSMTTAIFKSDHMLTYYLTSPTGEWKWAKVDYLPGGIPDQVQGHAGLIKAGYTDVTPAHVVAAANLGLKVPKPANISQQAWDAATGSEESGPALKKLLGEFATLPDEEIALKLAVTATATMTPARRLLLASAPDSVQRMAVWASSQASGYTDGGNPELGKEILYALAVKAEGGEYITSETQYWTGTATPIAIPAGAALFTLDSYSPGYTLLKTGSAAGYIFDPQGELAKVANSGYIKSAETDGKKLIESFASLTPAKALLEGFEFTQASWDALNEAETASWNGNGPEAGAAWQLKQALGEDAKNITYAKIGIGALVKKVHQLPPGVKALLVKAQQQKNSDLLTTIMWKVGKGYYDQPVVVTHPTFDPSKSYAKQIAQGQVSFDGINENWESTSVYQFVEDFGITGAIGWAAKIQAVTDKIAELQAATQDKTAPTATKIDPAKDLQLVLVGSAGGSHGAKKWADQYGELWLSKDYADDPHFSDYRVDAENTANQAARLFGFASPETFTKKIDGKHTYVQHWDDDIGNFVGVGPDGLNDAQLGNVMSIQVFDWMGANHDSYGANLLRHPDGKKIIGIDKGQFGKHWHDDKLEVGYLPPENFDDQWYDLFFKAVQSGKIDRARAERVAQQVLFKAHQVQSQHDARYQELLSEMLDARPKDGFPAKYPTKAKLLAAAMDRKHSLVADFEKLYKGVWEKAGWDWQIDTSDFGKKVGHAHVSNGHTFTEDLAKTKTNGLSLMVDSRGVADAHFIFLPMKAKDGSVTMLGSGKICEGADKLLTAWFKDRVEGPMAGGASKPAVVVAPNKDLYGIEAFHEQLIAYAKTVGQHAPNGGKEPNGEYNAGTVQAALTQQIAYKAYLKQVLAHRDTDPTMPKDSGVPKFLTLEQQDAWVAAAQKKLAEFDQVIEAHKAGKPVHIMFEEVGLPPDGGFKGIVYNPTKGLGKPGGIAESYVGKSGEKFIRTADGGHYKIDKDGQKKWLSRQDFQIAIKNLTKETLASPGEPGAVVATEKWKQSGTGDYYELQPDGTWQLFDSSGVKLSQAVSKATMDSELNSDASDWTYDNGVAVEEKTVEHTALSGKQFKVSHQDAALHNGVYNGKLGQMVETKKGATTEFQTGTEYVVNYEGITIRYRPWTEPQVKKVQQGNLSFEIKQWDGQSPAQIDDVFDTLRMTGLEIEPATALSLELHYWRHVTEQAGIDGSKNPAKIRAIQMNLAGLIKPNMTQEEELAALKSAWATAIGQEKVDKADWEPKFHTWGLNVVNDETAIPNGRPSWMRPDFSLQDLYKIYGNGSWTPIHATSGTDPVISIAQTNGLIPSEERVRALGNLFASSGAGSGSKQSDQQNAATSFLFSRQFSDPWGSNSGVGGAVGFLIDPRDALRATTYAIPGDKFGDRGGSVGLDPAKMYSQKLNGNELLIRDGMAARYLVVKSEYARTSMISNLKAAGVTTVNGRPVEEWVIGPDAWKAKMKEMWKVALAEEAAEEKK